MLPTPKDSSKPVTSEKEDRKPFTGTTTVRASEKTPLLPIVGPAKSFRISTYHAQDPKATTRRVDFKIHAVDAFRLVRGWTSRK